MALFKKEQPQSFLGVDISSDGIKVVELKNNQGKPQLVTYGYSKTRTDGVKGALIDNLNVTSTLLKEICDKAKCTTKYAVAALPTEKTFTYVLKIQNILKKDLIDPSKVKTILKKEAEKILPTDPSTMQFDYTIINAEQYAQAKPEEALKNVKFLITAASNQVVKQYSQIFAQAGLELQSLDIESFALVRSLVGNDTSLIMVVDFGQNTTSLSMVDNGIPVFNRSVDIGGDVITKKLADTMNITMEEAEQYKLDLPILMKQQNLGEMPKPIMQAVGPIIAEIQFLQKTYYQQVSNEKQLDRIILTGGAALLAGFSEHVEAQTDVRTYIGDPWARIIHPVELKGVLAEIGPRYAVALGLAMTKIR